MTLQATPKIAAMAAYPLTDLTAPPGITLISLAQNESARAPSPLAIAAGAEALASSALYPDPDWSDLRAAIADVHGLDPAEILCGAGSMELIGALAHAYLGPGSRALSTAHGYLYFRTATTLAGAEMDLAPERDLTVDVDALLAAVRPETRVVFVANPGNPTGTVIPASEIIRLRDGLPGNVLLVIDMAYGEFAQGLDSAFDLVDRGDTVVLRTFSKAYGLAAMRVGWGLFPPAVSAEIRKILNPNNISTVSQAAAAAAIRDQVYMRQTVVEMAAGRTNFVAAARQMGIEVPEPHTNFALLCFADAPRARSIAGALRRHGVLLRGMAGYGLPQALRATIGTEDQMQTAIEALAVLIEQEPAG